MLIKRLAHFVLLSFILSLFLPACSAPATTQPAVLSATQKRAPQVASYAIQVTLNPAEKTLTGTGTFSYTNTTDQPIPDLVFHLYLNAFRNKNTIWMKESGGQLRMDYFDSRYPGGITMTQLSEKGGVTLEAQPVEDGTLARATLPQPIAPGQTGVFSLAFQAKLPKVFARTGFASQKTGYDYFMVGQWFPKLGVWQNGAWNAYPFHANSEFYADFGNYVVDITLPANYVTGGGGVQVSSKDNGDGTKTVRYRSEQVIDFSWTASPHYKEATRQVGSVQIAYLYLPEHEWSVQKALDAAQAAVTLFGSWYGPYPYPRLTVVDVPDDGGGAGGMEYPTLITAGAESLLGLSPAISQFDGERALEAVIIHEIGHQWFQSMVATNEAEEPWLDEGFTDYSTTRAFNAAYPNGDVIQAANFQLSYMQLQRMNYMAMPNVPMEGKAWDFTAADYGIAAYSKPILALTTLERTLGEELMGKVMKTYFERYQFAHPTTKDFRLVAEEVSGQDLSWFFDGLVYGKGALDYTVTHVEAPTFTVERQGDLALPTTILVTFADGSQKIEAWDGKETPKTFIYSDRLIIDQVEVDPDRKLAVDLDWSNNGLRRVADLWSYFALLTRFFYFIESYLMMWGGL